MHYKTSAFDERALASLAWVVDKGALEYGPEFGLGLFSLIVVTEGAHGGLELYKGARG